MNEQDNKENIAKAENGESIETKDTTEQPAPPNTEQRKIEKKAKKEERRKKMYRRITVILLIVIVILILLLLQKCSSDVPVLNPDFPPQQTDPGQKPIPGDDDDKLDHEEGGGAVILDLSDRMTIDLSDKKGTLDFANPGSSSSNMVLWITIQDTVIAQSGLITPGYQIDSLDIHSDIVKMLSEGTYSGKFVIYFYDTENNERALVYSEVPVTITVTP